MNIFQCCQSSNYKFNQKKAILIQNPPKISLSSKSDAIKQKPKLEKNKQQISLSRRSKRKIKSNTLAKHAINAKQGANILYSSQKYQYELIRIPQKNIVVPPLLKSVLIPAQAKSRQNVISFQYRPIPQPQKLPLQIKPLKVEFNAESFKPQPFQQFYSQKQIFDVISAPNMSNNSEKENRAISINSTVPSSQSVIFSAKKLSDIDVRKAQSICDSQSQEDLFSQVLQEDNKIFLSHLVSMDQKFDEIKDPVPEVVIRRKTCPQQLLQLKVNHLEKLL